MPLLATASANASTSRSVGCAFEKPVRGSNTGLPVSGLISSCSNSDNRAFTAPSFSSGIRASFHVTLGVLICRNEKRSSSRARKKSCEDGNTIHGSFG